jgi:hypothetical protein
MFLDVLNGIGYAGGGAWSRENRTTVTFWTPIPVFVPGEVPGATLVTRGLEYK